MHRSLTDTFGARMPRSARAATLLGRNGRDSAAAARAPDRRGPLSTPASAAPSLARLCAARPEQVRGGASALHAAPLAPAGLADGAPPWTFLAVFARFRGCCGVPRDGLPDPPVAGAAPFGAGHECGRRLSARTHRATQYEGEKTLYSHSFEPPTLRLPTYFTSHHPAS